MEFEKNRKPTLTLVGPYPPPVGGNSIHVKRLMDLLSTEFEICVLDPYGSSAMSTPNNVYRFGPPGIIAGCRLALFLYKLRVERVHIHISAMGRFLLIAPLLLLLTKRSLTRVVSIHSGTFSQNLAASTMWRRYLATFVLSQFDRIVTVNLDQRKLLQRLLNKRVHERIDMIPAFIPEYSRGPSARVQEIAEKLPGSKCTIVTSGSADPIYGLESVVRACGELSNVRLFVCVYGTHSGTYMSKLKSISSGFGNILVVEGLGDDEFNQLLGLSDIYVRATDRDGDSVALREALGKGLAVVASDAAKRPAETYLYRHGDDSDLKHKIQLAMLSYNANLKRPDIEADRENLRKTYVRLFRHI